jgi:hypothetical protein
MFVIIQKDLPCPSYIFQLWGGRFLLAIHLLTFDREPFDLNDANDDMILTRVEDLLSSSL